MMLSNVASQQSEQSVLISVSAQRQRYLTGRMIYKV